MARALTAALPPTTTTTHRPHLFLYSCPVYIYNKLRANAPHPRNHPPPHFSAAAPPQMVFSREKQKALTRLPTSLLCHTSVSLSKMFPYFAEQIFRDKYRLPIAHSTAQTQLYLRCGELCIYARIKKPYSVSPVTSSRAVVFSSARMATKTRSISSVYFLCVSNFYIHFLSITINLY